VPDEPPVGIQHVQQLLRVHLQNRGRVRSSGLGSREDFEDCLVGLG
jgi:hypothetical protein